MSQLDDMIAWENGELDEKKTIKLFQELVNNGMAWRLQGMYGRQAKDLLDAGLIHYPVKHTAQSSIDYYGNPIPTKAQDEKIKKDKMKPKKPTFGSVAWQNEQAKKIQAKIKTHKPLDSADKAFANVQLQHNLGIGEKQAENIVKKANMYLSRPVRKRRVR